MAGGALFFAVKVVNRAMRAYMARRLMHPRVNPLAPCHRIYVEWVPQGTARSSGIMLEQGSAKHRVSPLAQKANSHELCERA